MDDKLRQIAPREMADVKQLQDRLTLPINLFEQQLGVNEELRKENKSLKGEIDLLKRNRANPKFPNSTKTKQPLAGTSPVKKKSGKGKNHKSGGKKNIVEIHRMITAKAGLSTLPDDTVLKEYNTFVQQAIRFETYNTAYRMAIYHSVSEEKTYRGEECVYDGGKTGWQRDELHRRQVQRAITYALTSRMCRRGLSGQLHPLLFEQILSPLQNTNHHSPVNPE
jgi:hypothetical protein